MYGRQFSGALFEGYAIRNSWLSSCFGETGEMAGMMGGLLMKLITSKFMGLNLQIKPKS
jgi:hypothetical protein